MGAGQSKGHEVRQILEHQGTADTSSLQLCSKLLVENPSLIVHRQATGDTLFHLTARNGGSVAALLTLEDSFRGPASFYAHLSPEQLNAKLAQILNVGNVWGETPLTIACARGHTDFVLALLTMGANPHIHDQNGLTAVHHAARGGHVACMKAVLDAAQPSEAQARCPTLLHDAISAAGLTALHFAVAHAHPKCVEILLEAGAKLNPRSRVFTTELGLILSPGSTALHIAAKKGHEAMAMLILRHYASRERISHQRDVDVRRMKDADGRLPAEVAYQSGCSEALVSALDPAADVEDIFSIQDLNLPGKGASRLSIIAAAALQGKLMSDLELVSPGSPAAPRTPADRGANTKPAAAHQAACGWVVQGLPAAGRAGSLTATCALCMEHTVDVRTGACSHALCAACARQLCSRIGDRPPACPFCRRAIGAFKRS